MTGSQNEFADASAGHPNLQRLWKPITEWTIWMVLGIVIYSLTGAFDQEIAEYAFGAAGWPRALCIAVFIGATGQLGYQVLGMSRGGDAPAADDAGAAVQQPARLSGWRVAQRLGIFVFPLIYLYVTPSIGFYVSTPVFILGVLLLLEVRSPVALATVTCVVYGLLLVVFTRFFYVALPVGQAPPFYDINNAIIVFARTGL